MQTTGWVTGIDEVGRGCLAGPVVVASVRLNLANLEQARWLDSLQDSKKLSPKKRLALFPIIVHEADLVRVASISHVLVDYLNVLRATMHGFEMVCPPYREGERVYIDGNQRPPSLGWAQTVVGGDGKIAAVSAASIIAKTVRDRLMTRLAWDHPAYGFESHVGYGTKTHLQAIARHGPSRWHRKSFRPISLDLPQSAGTDRGILERAQRDVPTRAWRHFIDHYTQYSLPGCQRVVRCLQQRGLQLLPCPDTLRPSLT